MDAWQTLPLSFSPHSARSLPLLVNEYSNISSDYVSLHEGPDGSAVTAHTKGVATVTTHRLTWIGSDADTAAYMLPHESVAGVDANNSSTGKGGGLFKMLAGQTIPKITVVLLNGKKVYLGFKNGDRDSFLSKYKAALAARRWDTTPPLQQAPSPSSSYMFPTHAMPPSSHPSHPSHPSHVSHPSALSYMPAGAHPSYPPHASHAHSSLPSTPTSSSSSSSSRGSLTFDTSSAGVTGLMRNVSQKNEDANKTLDQALAVLITASGLQG
eukprot:TRINITY_DN6991_c1_g1_i1.p1 TRINITY_DN6991_c1_g1~~TRINITY_DN6991_c1_g1_i1.p1  ORF type:complete len:268 (-),score=48.55 TRINITY_DN6991_c1_g1_i1:66-869(-)